MNQALRKLLQRQLYDLLANRNLVCLCWFLLVSSSFLTIFVFREIAVNWGKSKCINLVLKCGDNIGAMEKNKESCDYVPIDAVYTWVNGSDPQLIQALRETQNEIRTKYNISWHSLEGRDSCGQRRTSDGQSGSRTIHDRSYYYYLRMPLVWVQPFKSDFLGSSLKASQVKIESDMEGNLLYFKDVKEAQDATKRKSFIYQGAKYEIFSTFIRVSCETQNLVDDEEEEEEDEGEGKKNSTIRSNLEQKTVTSKSLIFLPGYWTKDKILKSISETERVHLDHILLDGNKSWAVVCLKTTVDQSVVHIISRKLNNKLLKKRRTKSRTERQPTIGGRMREGRGKEDEKMMLHLRTRIRFIIGNDYFFTTQLQQSDESRRLRDGEAAEAAEEISEKRFADNEELRYSLRSLEKFAPWIRRVYILTNGQIPYWLNLDNPRVKIITHQDIFENEDDLPTFNSAAIETKLHRIPGISDRFLYLNDDTLFGKKVYPDDFYTKSKGYKVYLTWPVPDCADNCPSNWIKDGFCDPTCNTSNCNWDGGDCLQSSNKSSYSELFNQSQLRQYLRSEKERNCHANCPNNWLADKFCDNVCNNEECAFDLGDCGLENLNKLVGSTFDWSQTTFRFPLTNSFFINLSNLLTEKQSVDIEEATYERNPNVRRLAINLQHKVLMGLVFNRTETNITILIKCKSQNDSSQVLLEIKLSEKHKPNEEVVRNEKVENQALTQPNLEPATTGAVHGSTTSPVFDGAEKSKSKVKIKSETYSQNPGPQILKDYLKVFNRSLIFTEKDKYQLDISDSIPEEVRKKMDFLYERRRRGHLTENGFIYEKYKVLKSWISPSSVTDSTVKGTFPWERQGVFKDISKLISTYELYADQSKSAKRHLMDIFADSLRYVNRLYDNVYGSKPRKVPAHMAHLLDVFIVRRLQERFPVEIRKTSSHKIRSSEDMQFAFSYFYFLMAETKRVNVTEILAEVDTDSSGSLSWNEMETLMVRLDDSLTAREAFGRFTESCFNLTSEDKQQSEMENEISINQLLSCSTLTEAIEKNYASDKENPYEIVSDEEVAFKMVSSNSTKLILDLKDLRRKPKKFICLNDDIDHNGSNESKVVKKLLLDFYESFLPTSSQFELPPGKSNPFSNFHEYSLHKLKTKSRDYWIQSSSSSFHFPLILTIFFLILIMFHSKRRLIKAWKRLLQCCCRRRRSSLEFRQAYNF